MAHHLRRHHDVHNALSRLRCDLWQTGAPMSVTSEIAEVRARTYRAELALSRHIARDIGLDL